MPTPQDFADFRAAYQRLSPHPEHFDEFLAALSADQADLQGWSDAQLAGDHRAGADRASATTTSSPSSTAR